jgi:hypothetical protein
LRANASRCFSASARASARPAQWQR